MPQVFLVPISPLTGCDHLILTISFLGVHPTTDFVESFPLWQSSCAAFWQTSFLLFKVNTNGQLLLTHHFSSVTW